MSEYEKPEPQYTRDEYNKMPKDPIRRGTRIRGLLNYWVLNQDIPQAGRTGRKGEGYISPINFEIISVHTTGKGREETKVQSRYPAFTPFWIA